MDGTIARVIAEKGFGFVKGDDQKDYFFHRSDFRGFFDDLVEDTKGGRVIKVTFTPTFTTKGPRAADVVRTDSGI